MTNEAQKILDETRWMPRAAVWFMLSARLGAMVILGATFVQALVR